MNTFTVTMKASIDVNVEADNADDITAEMVEEALQEQHGDSRYVTVKNGIHFDHEDFEVLS